MYFIPHQNKLLSPFTTISQTQRYLITLLIAAFLTAIFYGIYWFIEKKIENVQRALQLQQQQWHQLCQSEHSCNIQKKEKTNLESQFNKYRFACQDDFGQQQLKDIILEAKKNNVRISELTIEKETEKSWYCQSDIKINMSGSLESIMSLLAALKTNGHMMQCKQFSCQRNEGNSFAAHCMLKAISRPTLQSQPLTST